MKEFWKSKTFWFNALFLVLTVAGVFGYGEFAPDQDAKDIAMAVTLVVNLILRFVTKEPITVRRAK